MRNIFTYIIALSLPMYGCYFQADKIETFGLDRIASSKGEGVAKVTVSTASIVNNQLVIYGSALDEVISVRVIGSSGFDETFTIESQTDSRLVVNGLKNISFAIGAVFNLIITDAYGAATFQVTFTLQDGAVTASKLSDMGAGVGQILKYDGTSWVPSDLGGLTYTGNWNANTNTPDLSIGGNLGEYYIVNTAGTYDLLGGAGTNSWAVGDWVVWNNVLTQWEKIDNATNVTSFNGRNGVVTPQPNDYTWAQINKTTSSLNDIADVNTTGIVSGKILKWNGTAWVIGDDLSSGGAGSVTTNEIAEGTIVDADISGTAAITQSKIANLSADLASKLPIAGGTMTGNIVMGANNLTFSTGLVDGVDVSALSSQVTANTTDISGKENSVAIGTSTQFYRGDKTWQTLDTAVVPENTNLYYTSTRARADTVADSITDTVTDVAPSQNAVFNALALKQDSSSASTDFVNVAGDTMTGTLNLPASGLVVNTNDLLVSAGNVGVGSTTPTAKMQIESSGGETYSGATTAMEFGLPGGTLLYLKDNSGSTTEDRFVGIGFSGKGPGGATRSAHIGAVPNTTGHQMELVFGQKVSNTTYVERMRIDTSGNVGIGTTIPKAKLDVAGNVRVKPVVFTADNVTWYPLDIPTSVGNGGGAVQALCSTNQSASAGKTALYLIYLSHSADTVASTYLGGTSNMFTFRSNLGNLEVRGWDAAVGLNVTAKCAVMGQW